MTDEINTLTDLEPRKETGTWLGLASRHSDADSLRREFGLAPFDAEAFDYQGVVPGALKHARDGSAWSPAGGTDFLALGKPGSGKSTLLLEWSARLLEVNNRPDFSEAVVWRGSESRSEWTPFAPWATVCLPASCEVDARVEHTLTGERSDVELSDIVREVRYYDDPRDLFQNQVEAGKFHVVYPDPEMRGCQELYEESPKTYDLEFEEGDPLGHWWIAAWMARVEHGPYNTFTSFVIDEAGDFLEESASKDRFSSYEKMQLAQDMYVDGRKFGVSFYMAGHNRSDLSSLIRKKLRWEVTLNGLANPTRDSQLVKGRTVPMKTNLSGSLDTGRAVVWTGENFCYPFGWSDIPKWTDEELKISLSVPEVEPRESSETLVDATEPDENVAALGCPECGDEESEWSEDESARLVCDECGFTPAKDTRERIRRQVAPDHAERARTDGGRSNSSLSEFERGDDGIPDDVETSPGGGGR